MSLRNVPLPPGYKVIEWMEPSMLGKSWKDELQDEFNKPYFIKMNKKLAFCRALDDSAAIYPPHEDVFAWSRHCDIEDVKVVIIGQDPSPVERVACGLSFSTKYPDEPCKSLKIIFEEMERDIGFIPPPHGDLTKWAKQGVLLLNAALTVEKNLANSHKNIGWDKFINAVIECINRRCTDVVFMLWGGDAKEKRDFIDGHHHVFEAYHPVYTWNHQSKFLGCEHFSKTNKILERIGKKIDWSL